MKAIVIALSLLFIATPCLADPVDARSILIDDQPFVAFDVGSAQQLLQMRIDLPKIKLKLTKIEELVEVKDLELATLFSANETLLETNSFLKTTVIDLQGDLDDAGAWYFSPYFWYVAGLVTGVGTTVAIVYAVN